MSSYPLLRLDEVELVAPALLVKAMDDLRGLVEDLDEGRGVDQPLGALDQYARKQMVMLQRMEQRLRAAEREQALFVRRERGGAASGDARATAAASDESMLMRPTSVGTTVSDGSARGSRRPTSAASKGSSSGGDAPAPKPRRRPRRGASDPFVVGEAHNGMEAHARRFAAERQRKAQAEKQAVVDKKARKLEAMAVAREERGAALAEARRRARVRQAKAAKALEAAAAEAAKAEAAAAAKAEAAAAAKIAAKKPKRRRKPKPKSEPKPGPKPEPKPAPKLKPYLRRSAAAKLDAPRAEAVAQRALIVAQQRSDVASGQSLSTTPTLSVSPAEGTAAGAAPELAAREHSDVEKAFVALALPRRRPAASEGEAEGVAVTVSGHGAARGSRAVVAEEASLDALRVPFPALARDPSQARDSAAVVANAALAAANAALALKKLNEDALTSPSLSATPAIAPASVPAAAAAAYESSVPSPVEARGRERIVAAAAASAATAGASAEKEGARFDTADAQSPISSVPVLGAVGRPAGAATAGAAAAAPATGAPAKPSPPQGKPSPPKALPPRTVNVEIPAIDPAVAAAAAFPEPSDADDFLAMLLSERTTALRDEHGASNDILVQHGLHSGDGASGAVATEAPRAAAEKHALRAERAAECGTQAVVQSGALVPRAAPSYELQHRPAALDDIAASDEEGAASGKGFNDVATADDAFAFLASPPTHVPSGAFHFGTMQGTAAGALVEEPSSGNDSVSAGASDDNPRASAPDDTAERWLEAYDAAAAADAAAGSSIAGYERPPPITAAVSPSSSAGGGALESDVRQGGPREPSAAATTAIASLATGAFDAIAARAELEELERADEEAFAQLQREETSAAAAAAATAATHSATDDDAADDEAAFAQLELAEAAAMVDALDRSSSGASPSASPDAASSASVASGSGSGGGATSRAVPKAVLATRFSTFGEAFAQYTSASRSAGTKKGGSGALVFELESSLEALIENALKWEESPSAVGAGAARALCFCSARGHASQNAEVEAVVKDALRAQADAWTPVSARQHSLWNLMWTWSQPKGFEWSQLLRWQRVNHFPSTKALTCKDLLKKQLGRVQSLNTTMHTAFHIMPRTFILPDEFMKFVHSFRSREVIEASEGVPNLWIMKPIGLSRGRGIRLVSSVADVTYAEVRCGSVP